MWRAGAGRGFGGVASTGVVGWLRVGALWGVVVAGQRSLRRGGAVSPVGVGGRGGDLRGSPGGPCGGTRPYRPAPAPHPSPAAASGPDRCPRPRGAARGGRGAGLGAGAVTQCGGTAAAALPSFPLSSPLLSAPRVRGRRSRAQLWAFPGALGAAARGSDAAGAPVARHVLFVTSSGESVICESSRGLQVNSWRRFWFPGHGRSQPPAVGTRASALPTGAALWPRGAPCWSRTDGLRPAALQRGPSFLS